MAKKKKGPSIVSTSNIDRLPNPEEAARRAGEAIKKIEPKQEPEADQEEEPKYKRTTILVDPDLVKQMKVVAAAEGKFIYEVMNEAMSEYIDKYR